MPLTKALRGLKVTDADQGEVSVLFATLNVIDHDGDVTMPGAFKQGQEVRISAYNHASWGPGALPVGKGAIREEGEKAIFDGQFFLNTLAGRDTFETVKAMGDLQEWSYGYDILDASPGQQDGQDVQFLKGMDVFEVSPVLLGAGIDTRTLSAKSYKLGDVVRCRECQKACDTILGADGKLKAAVCPDHGKQLDSQIENQLQDAGGERYGTSDIYVYLVDHDDDEGFAIYRMYGDGGDCRTIQVNYSRNAGSVVLAPGEQEVEATVTFTPKARADAPEVKADPEPKVEPASETAPPSEGMKLADHLVLVQQHVDELTKRLRDVVALRAEKGKSPSSETVDGASTIAEGLDAAAKTLREVVTSADDPQPEPAVGDADNALTLEDETQLAELAARHGLSL